MTKPRMSPTTLAEFCAAFPHHSNAELAIMFGVKECTVENYGVRHKLRKSDERISAAKATSGAPWTAEQIAYLRANYSTQSTSAIARYFGRTTDQVTEKARRIGVRKDKAAAAEAQSAAFTRKAHCMPGWNATSHARDSHARLTAEDRAKLPAVIPPTVKVTQGPGYVDTRFSVKPGESTYGAGFAALGPGRYCEDGRQWGRQA